MADRSTDSSGLDRLRGRLLRYHRKAQDSAHIRCQLVLRWFYYHHCRAAHCQQRRVAGGTDQVLLRLRGSAGRHDSMVVWPQCGGVFPDRGLSGHHVLAGLFLSTFGSALLGIGLHLYLGWTSPPALHRTTRLDTVFGYGFLGDSAGPQLGRHDQRHHDPVRCLGKIAYRPDPEVPGGFDLFLRHGNLRGSDDGHQDGERTVTLHRLDDWARALRRTGLGRHDLDWCHVFSDTTPVWTRDLQQTTD